MLKALRHKGAQKQIVAFIAVTVVLGFVVSLIVMSHEDKKGSSALAMLEGRKISTQDYLNSYRAVQHQLQWMYGDRANELRGRVNLKGEAWDRILLLAAAKKERIHVSDNEVVDWITSQKTFQRKDVFDQKYYEMFVERALRMDPRSFEEEARELLTMQKLRDKQRDNISVPEDELKKAYQAEKSEKDLLIGTLSLEKFRAQTPDTTDKDIEQLYALLKNKLTTSDEVKLSYVTIPSDQFEIKKAALDDNAPLEDLLQKYALTKKQTPFFSKKDPLPELGFYEVLSQAFALETGKESGWIRHEGGATKLRMDEKRAGHAMSLEEAKEQLKKISAQQKSSESAMKKMREIREKLKTGDFETVMKAEGVTVEPLMKYHPGAANPVTPPAALDRALTTLKEGEVSEPTETAKGPILVKIAKISGADEKAYPQEKEAFREHIVAKKADDKMNELLESQRKKLVLNLELMKDIFPGGDEGTK